MIWSAAAKRPRSTTVAGTTPVIVKVTRQVSITPLPVFGACRSSSAGPPVVSGHPISLGLSARRHVRVRCPRRSAARPGRREAPSAIGRHWPARRRACTTNWANEPGRCRVVPARDHARGGRLFDPGHLALAERNGPEPARLAAGHVEGHLAARRRACELAPDRSTSRPNIAGPARQVGHGRRRTGGERRHAEGHHGACRPTGPCS